MEKKYLIRLSIDYVLPHISESDDSSIFSGIQSGHFKPLSKIFSDRHGARKKFKNIASNVTVETKKIKLYVQIECYLGYIMIKI